jgi:hypothetical protein
MVGKRFKVKEEIYASRMSDDDQEDRLLKVGKEFLVVEVDWIFATI